jgi:hypothetical protein
MTVSLRTALSVAKNPFFKRENHTAVQNKLEGAFKIGIRRQIGFRL